jgi:hypothetical protein
MFRRLPYYFVVVVALAYVALKWMTFSYDLTLIEAGSAQGYLSLGYLILVLAAAVVAIFVMRRNEPSTARRGKDTAEGPERSLHHSLHRLRANTHAAFARSPIGTSIRLLLAFLVLAAIPIGLVSLGHPGGLKTFASRDWLLVGMMEVPIVFVVVVMLGSIR